MRRARAPKLLSPLVVLSLIVGPLAAPATPASADSCAQLTLTLVMDWPVDAGVTARWGSYDGPLARTGSTAPFVYRGDIVVPLASYSAPWSYRVNVGPHVVFDSGPSWGAVSLGGGRCSDVVTVYRAAGSVSVRAFADPTGTGAVDPFAAPFYEGIAGVPIHICLLSLTSRGCVPGSEELLGSPLLTTAAEDFTVGWGGLRGRFRIWADAPDRYVRTYPTSTSAVLDCGAPSNACTAQQGQWIVELQGGGTVWFDLGFAGPVGNGGALTLR